MRTKLRLLEVNISEVERQRALPECNLLLITRRFIKGSVRKAVLIILNVKFRHEFQIRCSALLHQHNAPISNKIS